MGPCVGAQLSTETSLEVLMLHKQLHRQQFWHSCSVCDGPLAHACPCRPRTAPTMRQLQPDPRELRQMLDHKDSPYIRAVRQGGVQAQHMLRQAAWHAAGGSALAHHTQLAVSVHDAHSSHPIPRRWASCTCATCATPASCGTGSTSTCVTPRCGSWRSCLGVCVGAMFCRWCMHAPCLVSPDCVPHCLPQEFDPSPQGQGCMVTMGDFVRDIVLDQVGPECCRLVCFMLPRWHGCCICSATCLAGRPAVADVHFCA